MTSGTWTTQNKIRPGVYINFEGEPRTVGSLGDRGIAAFPAPLPWGSGSVIVLNASTYLQEALAKIGFHAADPRIRHVTAAMNHASRVLIYRLGTQGAVKATATVGVTLTATAKYGGTRGNDLTIVVQENVDQAGTYDVFTYLEGEEVDVQSVSVIADLKSNNFIDFSGAGIPVETAGTNLVGGADGSISSGDYSDAFAAFETEEFNVLGIPTDDVTVKQLAASYVTRLRDEGKKVQTVVHDFAGDSEGVINLKNSIVTSDGLTVPAIYLLWEIAAMEAAANVNESLTYRSIPNAVDVNPKLTGPEIVQALRNGEMVLTAQNGRVVIEQDINSLTSFSPTKPQMFSKNRVIRVLDTINNDFVRIFSEFFIGKVDNNQDGRNLFKGECISYLENLQAIGAIQNFDSQTDIIVEPGDQIDSVYAEIYIQPVDSIEKFYINVIVRQGNVTVQGGAA